MEEMSELQRILESDGEFETRSYSGRGMYGDTCLGVTIDGGIGRMLALIVESADEDNREALGETLRSMRTDSMGRGTIVYFPGTPYVGEDDEEECEECGDEHATATCGRSRA